MTEWIERNGFIPIPTQSLTDDEIQVVKSILGEPWEEKKMADICTDNRFELIEKYKKALIDSTNIESAQDEMAVLDNLLFRFWQMGWLDRLEQPEQRWIPCSERLPEDYGEFLVTMTEKAKAEDLGFDLDKTYIRKMRYNSNGWQLPRHIPSWINEAVKDEVLAWMPLPVQEPYQEECEKDGKDT